MKLSNIAAIITALALSDTTGNAQEPGPDAAMMRAPEVAAQFVDTLNEAGLREAFASDGVVIVDNTAPYVFVGAHAVEEWAATLRSHLQAIENLRHHFGPPQEFSITGNKAYFSMPVTWTEVYFGKPVTEKGAWVFVMLREGGEWKIKTSVWGRTETTPHH